MPTGRGWWLVAVGWGLALSGRVLGMVELFGLAAAALSLVAGAMGYVTLRRFGLVQRRHLQPGRVVAGGQAVVELSVANQGRGPSPVLEAADGAGRALLGPLRPGDVARWRYRLPCPSRGIVAVGPAALHLTDPFGIATRRGPVLGPSSLIVQPRCEAVVAPPRPIGRRHPGGAVGASPVLDPGEFHALRLYQHGDDLRRVHWPTAARLDELVVRHDEGPQPWHYLVVLDLRDTAHDSFTAEVAIAAAASVARACVDHESVVRVVTTGGFDSGLAGGPAHLEAVLDALAVVGADRAEGLGPVATMAGAHHEARTMVVVSGSRLEPSDLTALAPARGHGDTLVAVRVLGASAGVRPIPGGAGGGGFGGDGRGPDGGGGWGGDGDGRGGSGGGGGGLVADFVVDVAPGTAFGRVWDATFDQALARR